MDKHNNLLKKIKTKNANIGIIGLGYVGLPLVIEFAEAGFSVTGSDLDEKKVQSLKDGNSYISHIPSREIADIIKSDGTRGRFTPTTDFSLLADMECIIICVPTPLNKYREPDLSYVFETTKTITKHLIEGQLIVLESTTYPGTTDQDMLPILETSGFKAGKDFFLAYSPEREDPSNKNFSTRNIPKVVGGLTKSCLSIATALYDSIITETVPVSTTKVAEASKLLENIYRSVNIALINELKMLFDKMDIDIWEVIEAAKTKPFGFQPFYPGPGLGGHCIPIDPFYLTWKAKEYDFSTRFIELAGEINTSMPYYIIERLQFVLNGKNKNINNSTILILGVAYKKNIDDQRESPALKIMNILKKLGANIKYNDPYIAVCSKYRNYPDMNLKSIEVTKDLLTNVDMVLLLADHDNFDYAFIEKHAQCIVDTRNAFRKNGINSDKIFMA